MAGTEADQLSDLRGSLKTDARLRILLGLEMAAVAVFGAGYNRIWYEDAYVDVRRYLFNDLWSGFVGDPGLTVFLAAAAVIAFFHGWLRPYMTSVSQAGAPVQALKAAAGMPLALLAVFCGLCSGALLNAFLFLVFVMTRFPPIDSCPAVLLKLALTIFLGGAASGLAVSVLRKTFRAPGDHEPVSTTLLAGGAAALALAVGCILAQMLALIQPLLGTVVGGAVAAGMGSYGYEIARRMLQRSEAVS